VGLGRAGRDEAAAESYRGGGGPRAGEGREEEERAV